MEDTNDQAELPRRTVLRMLLGGSVAPVHTDVNCDTSIYDATYTPQHR
ncbi:MAG: hypothetical protein ABJD24_14480 [Acidimicrobiales bacterium]